MKVGSEFIIVYTILWLIVFYIVKHRNRYFGASAFLILLNIVCSVSSILLYNYSVMSYKYQYGIMTMVPFVYLFVSELLVMSPLLRYNEKNIAKIQGPNAVVLIVFSYILIIASIIQFPFVVSNLQNGLSMILLDDSGGAELYAEIHDSFNNSRFGILERITSIIMNTCGDIGILVFLYLLSVGINDKFIKYGYMFSITLSLLLPLSKGLRTGATMEILTFAIAYITMRKFLPVKLSKQLKRIGLIGLVIVSLFFTLISVSRFGDREGGTSAYFLSYVGQGNIHFNEHGLDANGIRNGDRTMNTFKQLLGFENVPSGIMETRDRYALMRIGDEYFTTYIGDFTLDFGPVTAFLIFALFAIVVNISVKFRGKTIHFHDLLLLYFVMCICVQGSFYLFNYSYKGNYTIIMFLTMYILFKISNPQKSIIKQ